MSENPSIEDVMKRIRARVEQQNLNSAFSMSGTPTNSHGEFGNITPAVDRRTIPGFETQPNDLSPLKGEIETALEGNRRVGQINPRNPGLHNDAIQFVKKIMRRSLTWYTRPLHYFQGGVIRALQRIQALLESHARSFQRVAEQLVYQTNAIEQTAADIDRSAAAHAQEMRALAEELSGLRKTVLELTELASGLDRRMGEANADLKTKLARAQSIGEEKIEQMRASYGRQIAGVANDILSLRSGIDQLSESLRRTQLQGRLRDRDFRRFVHDVRSGVIEPSAGETAAPVPPMFPSDIRHEFEFDYFAFEDLYRGEETLIRRRQEEYLQYFRGRDNILDVGCGRGEFLELLRDNNISAKGVELGTDQYLLCQEKGLDVVQQDLFSYLESLPDESLGGLFSAQVIEHLTASDQLRYVALTHRKTKPGSPVILETINAQCVWAVMRNFFIDPTHVRPVHPETLKFAMESANFDNVALLFSSPLSDHHIPPLELDGEARNLQEFNRQLQNLNELLYGNQDYAAIGWR